MKTIFIGDIHGHDTWKKIVNKEQDADRFVFVGDYFDSFTSNAETQINNFLDIMAFKNSGEKEVICIIGNHDYHYFPEIGNVSCAGYQNIGKILIEPTIDKNRDNLQMAYQTNNILVTHAGVGINWLNNYFKDWDINKLDVLINEMFKYKPFAFKYNGEDYTGYGNHINQTPIWIRPQALLSVNYKSSLKKQLIQIVGHTPQSKIDIEGKSTGGRYYFIDTLGNGEYLINENNEMKIGFVA